MEIEVDGDDGYFSLHQILDIEGLEDDLLMQNMGLECHSSSDEDNEQQRGQGAEDIPHHTQQQTEQPDAVSYIRKKGDLPNDRRREMVDDLLSMEKDGKLPWGAKRKIAAKYGIHRQTLDRIWNIANIQRAAGEKINVKSRKCNSGRKPSEYDVEWLQSVPLHLRTTIRSFAGALKIAPSTMYKLLKKGKLRSHTSSNHPNVSNKHKLQRMKWFLSHIIPATAIEPAVFVNMENVVHIDKKWFYLNPDMRRFYLLPFEDVPYRCTQSKRYKIKAMFMGIISRPIHDNDGNLIHDGKFGIFPFVNKVTAKKSSKNRAAGTVETKAMDNITQKEIRSMIINKVIPAIMHHWPVGLSKDIYIQQDNARPHIPTDDPEFVAAATQNGFNIKLIFQPPQSPDLNILDLGFFRAIQALQYQAFPRTLDDLIEKVQDSYDFFDPEVLKDTWLQLQYVMVEILKVYGGNNYKNPHHGKSKLERLGLLPDNVIVEQSLIDQAVKHLNENEVQEDEWANLMEVDAD